jgi:Carboxypeptidase regulatory-like domain
MAMKAAVGAALVWAGVLGQQPTPARPSPSAAATGQISGTIKSAADDKPLPRARVVASSGAIPEPRAAITNTDGSYVLSDLPAGSYTISVTRTGYASQLYGQGRAANETPIALGGGQRVDKIDMALVPGGVIAGRILDEDGTPFASAVVEALVTRTEGGSDTLVSVATSRTDDRGEFRLFGLAPGRYYVSAQDPAFSSVSSSRGVLRYSPTYYPGTPQADQAKTIAVGGAGEAPRVEFRIKLTPPARVSGQLVAYDGRELLSGTVIMSALEGEGVPMVPPDDISLEPDGRFAFGHVAPGRYQIRARAQTDPSAAALFAVFSTDVAGRDIEGIRMTLRPGALLDGRLTIDNRRGTKPPALSALRVRAPFTDGNSFGDALTGTVQADGAFALRGVMAGAHQIVIDGLQPPWVVKSVMLRGSDVTDLELTVHERDQMHGVRVTITDVAGDVSGVVQNTRNLPVADAAVLVFSRAPLFWMRTSRRMRVAYTDPQGRFTVPGLPAGEYLAVASPDIDESDLGRRDRLQALQAFAVPFRLATDDGHAAVTLRVPPAPLPGR